MAKTGSKTVDGVKEAIMTEAKVGADRSYFSSGSTLLDEVVGGGAGMGFPAGKIINIVGDKSSGKTFLACEIVAAAYARYKRKVRWVYDDAESGFGFDTRKIYGIDIIPGDLAKRTKSGTVEELEGNVRAFVESLKKDEVGIYILDSLDGLSSRENDTLSDKRYAAFQAGKAFDDGSYQMAFAKFLSQSFFRTLTDRLEASKCLLVIISQVRDAVNSMFETQVRAGGKALDFYAHTALWLSKVQTIEKKERAVGVVVKAKTKKSKTPRPYRTCFFTLLFDYGLDNIGTNIDYLFDLRTDSGQLAKGAAKSIQWDASKANPTRDDILAWMRRADLYDDFMAYTGGKTKQESIDDYLDEHGDARKLFEREFGRGMTRAELIEYIEDNNLEDDLSRRVIAKWEKEEEDVKTVRKARFETKPLQKS